MVLTCRFVCVLQNAAKGLDVYDETLHYPWLLRLIKSQHQVARSQASQSHQLNPAVLSL